MAKEKKRKQYSQEDLFKALAKIRNGARYNEVSDKYGIPSSTLHDKIKAKTPLQLGKPGPTTYLSAEQERRLIEWLVTMAKIGYGVVRNRIPIIVKEILDEAEKSGYEIQPGKKFVDNKPSVCWVYGFLKRHPEVSARTPENLGFQRAHVNEERIRKWFQDLSDFLKDEHGIDAVDFFVEGNGDRCYNLDESGFPLAGTNGKMKIITERGIKNVHKLAPDTKEQITVLACVSAGGTYSKPLVIYPGLRAPKISFDGVNESEYDVGFTPNG